MKKKLALAALLLSAIGTTTLAAQPNDPTSTSANGVSGSTNTSPAGTISPTPGGNAVDNGAANNPDSTTNSSNGTANSATNASGVSDGSTNTNANQNSSNTYNSGTGNNSGSSYTNAGVAPSKGPGLVEGVVETTDPDRIAAIQEHARQLEARQFDNYDAPAAGKRHHKHGHKHGASKGSSSKPANAPASNGGPVQ